MKKILIIEDDPVQQKTYRLKLWTKYNLDFASTGGEMLSQLGPTLPNLVILDIMLPGGKNGFDILSLLKDNPKTSSIPVIILTNLGVDQRQTALDCGAADYFTKIDTGMDQIADIVKKYI